MDFLEELRWRNLLQDITPGIEEELASKKVVAYIGFDPTAPSLTIGNFTQIMLLKLFQLSGHQPIIVMGGATGRVGDPSGKDKERQLKSYEELDSNLQFQMRQFEKFLSFDGDNKALFVNNLDFYKEMNVLTFLRDVGKTLTVSYMTSKESVRRRVDTGLSFTEFSYQLLQAYDFQCLYEQYGCTLQMGGSDQWGNITSGTEFIRRNTGGKAYAITIKLLTKTDGSKFGKSEKGNIWLDPEMTSPYQFYQFWINSDDADIAQYYRYFTLHSQAEIEAREKELADNPRELKRLLAEELTKRVHSEEAYEAVLKVSQLLFAKASKEVLESMDTDTLSIVANEIPNTTLSKSIFEEGISITELLTDQTSMLSSNGDVRRAIKNNAIAVNKTKMAAHDAIVNSDQLLHGKYILLENGRKNKFMVVVE